MGYFLRPLCRNLDRGGYPRRVLIEPLNECRPLCNSQSLLVELLFVELLVAGVRSFVGAFELLRRVEPNVLEDIEYVDLLLGIGENLFDYRLYLLIVVG